MLNPSLLSISMRWALGLSQPHPALPAHHRPLPSSPGGQRQMLSPTSSCVEPLGCTSSAASSPDCFSLLRESKGKGRWKLHVSCQLDFAADQGTRGEKRESAPGRSWLQRGAGRSAVILMCPILYTAPGCSWMLGAGLRMLTGGSSQGWPCTEPEATQAALRDGREGWGQAWLDHGAISIIHPHGGMASMEGNIAYSQSTRRGYT